MVRINLMNNLWVQNAIPFLLLVLGLFSSPAFAETEQRCEAYVQSSLLQHRENLANLRQCISANKSSISGNQGGVDYLSYLHAFGEEYYLFNFTGKDSNLRLKTHYIGNKEAPCGKESDHSGSFSLAKEKRGIAIVQRCSSEYQLEDGTTIRPDADYQSSKIVAFELKVGVWRPTFYYYSHYFHNSGDSRVGNDIYDWVTNAYFNTSGEYHMLDGWSGSWVETGQLLTKSRALGIGSFYPAAKEFLKADPSASGSCYASDRAENKGCDLVGDIKNRLGKKGSRSSEITAYVYSGI